MVELFAATMHLALVDWAIIIGYLGIALIIGLVLRRRASGSVDDFFLAGRSLPWWLAGTSMIATTFAADTPLAVTEYVRADGIWRNWFWWSMALFHVLGVFLFARLWRRAEVLTDAELCELRYDGRAAVVLRSLKAFLFAVPYNALVMGWVIAAMASVAEQMLGVNAVATVAVLCTVALVYASLSGLWGVVITDLLQLVLALGGTIAFAVLAVDHTGGLVALVDQVRVADPTGNVLRMVPQSGAGGPAYLPTPHWLYDSRTQFGVFVAVMWWANHNADGGGALMQRSAAAKDEHHALWAAFWFSLVHYAIRAWPWILVALCSVVLLAPGDVASPKDAYPRMMADLLPVGLRGILVASFLAAFMSTVDTHLNWGASYLVNDLYRRLWRPDRSTAHYLLVARLATVGLMGLAALTALSITSISAAWELVWSLGAGLGPVLILRWFWWRINAWSELSALASSLVLALILNLLDLPTHLKALILVPITLTCWITVTFLTRPVDRAHLRAFHDRVRPGGFWRPVTTAPPPPDRILTRTTWIDFAAGLAVIYGIGFAIGNFLVGDPTHAAALLALAATGAATLYWRYGRPRCRG